LLLVDWALFFKAIVAGLMEDVREMVLPSKLVLGPRYFFLVSISGGFQYCPADGLEEASTRVPSSMARRLGPCSGRRRLLKPAPCQGCRRRLACPRARTRHSRVGSRLACPRAGPRHPRAGSRRAAASSSRRPHARSRRRLLAPFPRTVGFVGSKVHHMRRRLRHT
jgi:hypothetical protein